MSRNLCWLNLGFWSLNGFDSFFWLHLSFGKIFSRLNLGLWIFNWLDRLSWLHFYLLSFRAFDLDFWGIFHCFYLCFWMLNSFSLHFHRVFSWLNLGLLILNRLSRLSWLNFDLWSLVDFNLDFRRILNWLSSLSWLHLRFWILSYFGLQLGRILYHFGILSWLDFGFWILSRLCLKFHRIISRFNLWLRILNWLNGFYWFWNLWSFGLYFNRIFSWFYLRF